MMKITLTENKLRSIIREAIIKHLNENIDNNGISVSNEELEKRLRNGEDLEDIFDGVCDFGNHLWVSLNNKWNCIDGQGNFISKQWFDDFTPEMDDEDYIYAFTVKLNNKWNVLYNGKLLYKQWFDYIHTFEKGYDAVKLNNKWNLINISNKHYLSKQWFDYITNNFINGYTEVVLNNKCNLIDEKGKILFSQWFDNIGTFHDGYVWVKLNNKCNFINKDGKLLSNQWFEHTENSCFDDCGYAGVELNGKWNYIDTDGHYLSKQWFDSIQDRFDKGFAEVKFDGKIGKLNTDGEIIEIENVPQRIQQINKPRIKKATKLSQA